MTAERKMVNNLEPQPCCSHLSKEELFIENGKYILDEVNSSAPNKYLKSHSVPTTPSVYRKETLTFSEGWPLTEESSPSAYSFIGKVDNVKQLLSKPTVSKWKKYIKLVCLISLWFCITIILMAKSERRSDTIHQISVPKEKTRTFWILEVPTMKSIDVELGGSLLPSYYGNMSQHWSSLWIEVVQTNDTTSEKSISFKKKISDTWSVPIVSESLIDFVPEVKRSHVFHLEAINASLVKDMILRIVIKTNINRSFPISLSYQLSPIDPKDGVLYAAGVLLGLYILIIFEIVHRTLAAMVASTASIAILATFDARPSLGEMVTWVDVETLLLLFSMMLLVTVFSETGVFDYLAVLACKITNGKVWPLINTLCAFTALLSSFLDNVTTALFMTPITIRLCEVIELNPVPILIAVVMYSNIGGALTPIGDPPNVIIATNKDVKEAGVNFSVFIFHMGIGLFLVMVYVHFHLRYAFRNLKRRSHEDPTRFEELKHEIEIWQRTAASLSSYTKDEFYVKETIFKKVRKLIGDLKRKISDDTESVNNYEDKLQELEKKFPIRNMPLLIKSTITLVFMLVLFFLHSVPDLNLSLGWTALLGVMLLLLLADLHDLESLLARVEWSTLIFFAALFILMEALSRLGLIDFIGRQTELVILSVGEKYRLTVAIVLILWVSALASSFVDNIPLTTMMVRIVTSLSQNVELQLPLQPLVWALALGACLGGNGTLIGASANVVCAGVAEQHGYRFSFLQFLKIGFPAMLGSVTITMAYLLVAHVAIGWNT
ncbi:unnamed protein product [Nezara viridula]|uniref:Citrate transporter-like domain-containing protein n=1 Tax=Nezara viridula TaxID=85310 RepID=A0A9P0H8V1_NEZVI|nr:unnamed protein product [Nezara viridula]